MNKHKDKTKKIAAYLTILFLTILATSMRVNAAIIDWFISGSLATKIVVIVVFLIVGIIVLVWIIAKFDVIGKVGNAAKNIKNFK